MTKKTRLISIVGDDAYITLTQGYTAVISAKDAHLVDTFCWSAHVERRKDGSIKNVYAHRVTSKDRFGKQYTIMLHRAIVGFPASISIDHIDMDGLNNRRENLRLANRSQNACNKSVRRDSLVGIKGVFRRANGRYQSVITFAGKRTYLGTFNTIEDASAAYAGASLRIHGEYGRI